jgi:SAM-dependent methyltransferase
MDYHDYIIKDGRFIGQFEEMYQNCEDPWHQRCPALLERCGRYQMKMMLRTNGISSALEVGSGLGEMAKSLHNGGIHVVGIDCSHTAVRKANAAYPWIHFKEGRAQELTNEYTDYDCVLFSELLWYVLPDLSSILKQIRRYAKHLAVKQTFYLPGIQQYGCDYFTTLEEFIRYCDLPLIESHQRTDNTIMTCSLFKIA